MDREYEGTSRVADLINPDGTIHKVYHRVKPDGHAQEILAEWD